MVRAGEASGRLDKSLRELAELRERTEALQAKLTSALIYPAILVLTALGSVIVLLTVVVPQIEPMFAQRARQAAGEHADGAGHLRGLRARGRRPRC